MFNMDPQLPATTVTRVFIDNMDDLQKQAQQKMEVQDWVRDQIRERCVCDKVMLPTTISLQDCQVSTEHDQLYRVEGMEPASKAMSMSFRGQPSARYMWASRYLIGFYKIGTARAEATELQLMTYAKTGIPIFQVVEKNAVTDMEEIRDWYFFVYSDAAVQLNQRARATGATTVGLSVRNINLGTVEEVSIRKGEMARAVGGAGDADIAYYPWPVQIEDINELGKMFSGDDDSRLEMDLFVITDHDIKDLSSLKSSDIDNKAGEVAVNGWTYDTVVGYKYVKTIKTSALRVGNIFGYTELKYLGKWYKLVEPKFYMDKIGDYIRWESWSVEGGAFANIASVRKIETYAGAVTPGLESNATAALARRSKAQDDLGVRNHRVPEGEYVPGLGGSM